MKSRQGQVLLGITPLESQVLDPRSRAQARAQVAAAESALHAAEQQAEAAEAAAKLAVIEHKRLQPLVEKGVISTDAFDKASHPGTDDSGGTTLCRFPGRSGAL